MRTRRLLVAMGALALVAGGCGDDDGSTDSAATTEASSGGGAETVTVLVDHKTDDFATGSFAYYPSEVTLHAGDTIEFDGTFTGEPHTVSAGTLLDEANAVFEALGDEGEPDEEQQAVLDKLPGTFNEDVGPAELESGANPFHQAGMQPCFASTEDEVTQDEACPNQDQPASYTGDEVVYSSGFLGDDAFTVQLDEALPAGDYLFFCLVHGAEMSTKVTIVGADQASDTAADVAERADQAISDALELVRPYAEASRAVTDPTDAYAGPTPDMFDAEDTGPMEPEVFPAELQIAAGETVTWTFTGFHTIAFNAPEDARPAWSFDDSGEFVINPKLLATGGPPSMLALEPPEGADPEAGPPFVPVDAGTYDGTTFLSSGPPPFSDAVAQWSLTFTTPGTYEYFCQIHPDMEGVVNVT